MKNILLIYPKGHALNFRSGGGSRILNFCNYLKKHNNLVILQSDDVKNKEDEDLKNGVTIHYYRTIKFLGKAERYLSDINPFFIIKFLKIIKTQKFDIIQLEFPWGFFISKILKPKNALLIYDSHGVEREFIKISWQNPDFPSLFKSLSYIYVKFYERIVCKLADLIINISKEDREYYIRNYKIKSNKTIVIQTPSHLRSNNPIEERLNFKNNYRQKLGLPYDKTVVVFHGGLPHPANKQAFDIISNKIAPKIRNSEIVFVLAGNNVEKFKKENIISLGFVENLKDLLISADFAIVPIIKGSGMRRKCLDYIATGLPVIITKKGLEGINLIKNGEDCLVHDNVDDEFIKSIHYLHKNSRYRDFLSRNIFNKSKSYSYPSFEEKLLKFYSKLLKI